jgi:hypothetical protein
VERRHPHLLGDGADERADPVLHLVGGLVRERDGEDLERADAPVLDQVGDPGREDLGLAAAGAGDDQQRAVGVGGGLALDGVEVVEQPPVAALVEGPRSRGVERGGHPSKLQPGDLHRSRLPD